MKTNPDFDVRVRGHDALEGRFKSDFVLGGGERWHVIPGSAFTASCWRVSPKTSRDGRFQLPPWEICAINRSVNIIARKTLESYWMNHAETEAPLRAWYTIARHAKWESPQDIKSMLPAASIVANNRVVFNIHGNDYRLVVAFRYDIGFGWIKFIGTHAEYDNIDVGTVRL